MATWGSISRGKPSAAALTQVMVRDMYKERDVGRFVGMYRDVVDAHGVLALKLTPVK